MSADFEYPADKRRRLAREHGLFDGLKRRAAGLPEQDTRSEHQRNLDRARADALKERKP